MQLRRGTGKALFKQIRCIWGTQEINWESVFLGLIYANKEILKTVQQHCAYLNTAAFFSLMGTKNLVPSACDSLLVLMQLALLCLGKVLPLSLPLFTAQPSYNALLTSLLLSKVTHADVASWMCGWVLLPV